MQDRSNRWNWKWKGTPENLRSGIAPCPRSTTSGEDLPAVPSTTLGEQAMLERQKLTACAEAIQHNHRVPKNFASR